MTSRRARQISTGSCSTQPARGRICSCSRCADRRDARRRRRTGSAACSSCPGRSLPRSRPRAQPTRTRPRPPGPDVSWPDGRVPAEPRARLRSDPRERCSASPRSPAGRRRAPRASAGARSARCHARRAPRPPRRRRRRPRTPTTPTTPTTPLTAPTTPTTAHRNRRRPCTGSSAAAAAARRLLRTGPSRREVAIGFDDGPAPDTGAFVTMLERDHVTATFFMIGEQVGASYRRRAAARAARRRRARRPHVHASRPHALGRRARAAAARRSRRSARSAATRRACSGRPTAPTTARSCRRRARSAWRRCCGTSTRATGRCRAPPRSSARCSREVRPGLDHHLPRRRRAARRRRLPPTRSIIAGLRSRGYRIVTIPELLGFRPVYRAVHQALRRHRRAAQGAAARRDPRTRPVSDWTKLLGGAADNAFRQAPVAQWSTVLFGEPKSSGLSSRRPRVRFPPGALIGGRARRPGRVGTRGTGAGSLRAQRTTLTIVANRGLFLPGGKAPAHSHG